MKKLFCICRSFALLLFYLCYASTGIAQTSSSLRDSVDFLNSLSEEKLKTTHAEAITLATKAYQYAIREEYTAGEAKASFILGRAFYLSNQLQQSLSAYERGFNLYLSINDSSNAGLALNGIGGLYMQKMNNHAMGLNYYNQAKDFLKNDSAKLIKVLNNIGTHYNRTGEYDKALDMYQKVHAIASKTGDSEMISSATNNIAAAHNRKGDYKTAIKFLEKGLALDKASGDYRGMANIYCNIAINYGELNDFDNAKKYSLKAIELGKQHEFHDIVVYALMVQSDQYENSGEFEKAIPFVEEAEQIAQKNNVNFLKGHIFKQLAEVNRKLNRNDIAFKYQEKYSNFNDSITKVERQSLSSITQTQQAVISPSKNNINPLLWMIPSACALGIAGFFLYKKRKNDKQLALTESLLKEQETERNKLAREIHDGLGSVLSSVKHNLTSMKGNMVISGEDMSVFNKSVDLIDHSMRELRTVAHNMMPEVVLRFGLRDALEELCERINTPELKVEFISVNCEERFDTDKEVSVYRIVQELINNILKYAEASHVTLQLLHDDNRVSVSVEDNGRGFDISTLKARKGAGWTNIHNRVELLNGKVALDSKPGQGTSVLIEFYV